MGDSRRAPARTTAPRGEANRRMNDPGGARTHDLWLKRPLLYQLSYRVASVAGRTGTETRNLTDSSLWMVGESRDLSVTHHGQIAKSSGRQKERRPRPRRQSQRHPNHEHDAPRKEVRHGVG